jgi:hypothetical protein
VTISDLADFLNIDSPYGYKNFVEELYPKKNFFDRDGILKFGFFCFFLKKVTFFHWIPKIFESQNPKSTEPVCGKIFEF